MAGVSRPLSEAGWSANWRSLVENGDGTFVLFVDEVDDELRALLEGVAPEFVISAELADQRERSITASPRELARRAEELLDWLTPRYRSSDHPNWAVVRRLLRERSIEIDSSWLAEIHPEDERVMAGWVVTGLGEVIAFEYSWSR